MLSIPPTVFSARLQLPVLTGPRLILEMTNPWADLGDQSFNGTADPRDSGQEMAAGGLGGSAPTRLWSAHINPATVH